MSTSYTEILQQIEELKAEAARLKDSEVNGVIARIKEAIAAYGLTASDLGFGGKPGRKPGRPVGSGKKPGPKPGATQKSSSKSKLSTAAKFRDANGNTWVGRGPRPLWLRAALANGKSLKDFAV